MCVSDGEKVSDYEMKLMDLDTEHLGIPVGVMSLQLYIGAGIVIEFWGVVQIV